MHPANPITIVLDRKREVRWTKRAQARNGSLPRPVSFASLTRRKSAFYAICAIIWASLVDRDHEFEAPEDLAEILGSEEKQGEALRAITAMIDEAYPEKKSSSTSSTSGPSPSSSVDSAPPVSTGGG